MNKRGQGGMSLEAIVGLVLLAVVAVVIILGFVYGWGNLAEKFKIFTPSTNLDDLTQSCNFAIAQPNAFCEYKLVTLDGVKQYVNCQDARILSKLSGSAPSACLENTPKIFCDKLSATGNDITKTRVNNEPCPK